MKDSFIIVFESAVSEDQVLSRVRMAAYVTDLQAGSLRISKGTAIIWIETYQASDPGTFDEQDEILPIPRESIATLMDVTVRHDEESPQLAVSVAHDLVKTFRGRIAWCGMDEWERLYNTRYGTL